MLHVPAEVILRDTRVLKLFSGGTDGRLLTVSHPYHGVLG